MREFLIKLTSFLYLSLKSIRNIAGGLFLKSQSSVFLAHCLESKGSYAPYERDIFNLKGDYQRHICTCQLRHALSSRNQCPKRYRFGLSRFQSLIRRIIASAKSVVCSSIQSPLLLNHVSSDIDIRERQKTVIGNDYRRAQNVVGIKRRLQ